MSLFLPQAADLRQVDGVQKQALETGRNRLIVAGVVITLAFGVIATRLLDLTVFNPGREPGVASVNDANTTIVGRADITDRNGILLATSLPTASLYVDPHDVLDADEAALKIASIMPDLNPQTLARKMRSKGRFVWLARNLTPQQHFKINRLGIPGLAFQEGERRVYPHGPMAAHVLGLTNVDGRGIAGIEQRFDRQLRSGIGDIALSIDLRVQSILQEELKSTINEFSALGGAGVVMDVHTGEMIAMASLPDFDPNSPNQIVGEAAFNRATKGVYEMGSTFKLFTAAMALDSDTVTMKSGYDASEPIRVARFSISDYHAKNRWLSVPEIILHSSNIGSAKMAVDVGTDGQREYLGRFGLLEAPEMELPEIGKPLLPSPWRPINTMTISYGHGIAVSPVQLANGIASLVNGGILRAPTVIKVDGKATAGERAIKQKTSLAVRRLMRLVVTGGTGRKADVPGYLVGGKTGTADKLRGSGYAEAKRIASFVGAFPMDAPRYVVLVVVDEPKGTKKTFNYATGGWVAAPTVKRIVARMAPVVGIAPDLEAVFETPFVPNPPKKYKQARTAPAKKPLLRAVSWKPSQNVPSNGADQFVERMRVVLERDRAAR